MGGSDAPEVNAPRGQSWAAAAILVPAAALGLCVLGGESGLWTAIGITAVLVVVALVFEGRPGRSGYLITASVLVRLAAMAGERLKMTGATEISAVCTHPDFQGRGYGRTLMEAMIARIQTDDAQPFLHVKNENGAKRLYEQLGFRVRSEMRLTVFTARAASAE